MPAFPDTGAGRSYEVTAEFYDLLHATEYLRSTERILDRGLGHPDLAVS